MAELIETGGRVYAEALFRAAVEAGRVREVDRDLSDFMESLAADRAVLGSLLNPRLPQEAKKRVIATLLRGADPLVRNAMLGLADNGRPHPLRRAHPAAHGPPAPPRAEGRPGHHRRARAASPRRPPGRIRAARAG